MPFIMFNRRRRPANRFATLLAGTAALATAITALPAQARKPQPPAPVLADYVLPRTVIEIDARFEIQDCSVVADDTVFKAKRTATLIARAEADPALRYRIKPSTLVNNTSKVDAAFTFYENGTIKTFNVTSEDRTAGIAAGIFGLIGGIFKLGVLALADGVTPTSCPKPLADAIALRKQYVARIEALRADQRTLELTGDPLDPKVADKIKALQDRIAGLQSRLGQHVEDKLVLTQKGVFTPTRGERTYELTPADKGIEDLGFHLSHVARVADKLKLQLWVATPGPLPVERADTTERLAAPAAADTAMGIVLRTPVRSTAYLCEQACIPAGAEATATAPADGVRVVQKVDADIAQFGLFTVMPLKMKLFEGRTLGMNLSPFGRLESLTFKSASRTETAVTGASDVVSKASTALKDIQDGADTREVERMKLEKSLLDAERELIDARKKLKEAREEAGGGE